MKPKSIKKLTLKKNTVMNLNNQGMSKLYGGKNETIVDPCETDDCTLTSCATCDYYLCTQSNRPQFCA